jgi:phosphoribosylformylglycinamidine synthase
MSKPTLAVIQFPGSNCEYETARAAEANNFSVEIIRWNQADLNYLKSFSAYILPGGFSYQDRIRSGVIASKLPVTQLIKEESEKGKLVLGICNGCQILAEAGLIDAALAPNTKDEDPIGFICDWVYVKVNNPQNCAFTKYFNETEIIPIPINHGEGRFILSAETEKNLASFSTFQYCTKDGDIIDKFPTNPNGSSHNLAGLCNAKGNVLAIMPHPERGTFIKQIPTWLQSSWVKEKELSYAQKTNSGGAVSAPELPNPILGPWAKLFKSMSDTIEKG